MDEAFPLSQFLIRFSNDENCLEEIKHIRYPKGIHCHDCKKITKHYKIKQRTAYACKYCRTQTYPLTDTIFEKTTTPLHLWFYALFLMTQTKGDISVKQLQQELRVTYKTAWRIRKRLRENNGDLLPARNNAEEKIRKWLFFNKIEFTVAERQRVEP